MRDWARTQFGVDLPYQDDSQAINALIQAYQQVPQLQNLARYGSEYLQNLRQPSVPAGAAPSQPQGWWAPPASRDEVQRALSQWYERDPRTGELKPRADAPHSVIQKVSDYQAYIEQFRDKFFSNPQDAIKEGIREEAKRLFEEQFQTYRGNDNAVEIIKRNAGWMFYKDASGTPQLGQYTPQGLQFYNTVLALDQAGVRDPYMAEQIAQSIVSGTYANQQLNALRWQAQQRQAPVAPPGTHAPSYVQPNGQGVPQGAGGLAAMLSQDLAADPEALQSLQRFSLAR